MATNKEIVTKVNEAFTKGDMEAFMEFCTEDFVWEVVGSFKAEGKKAVREFMAGPTPCEPPTFTVDKLFGEGDYVVCDGPISMKTVEDKDWKGRFCDMYTFKDGLVRELKSYCVEFKPEPQD